MAGRWINDGPQEAEEEKMTPKKALISLMNIACSAGIAIMAYLVGAKFSSLIAGIITYVLIELAHCIILFLLIDKETLQKLISLHATKDDEKMKELLIEQNNKHTVESFLSVILIYFVLHMMLGI